jgi:cytochrome c-type biogenesis protein CcmH/NrfF
MSGTRRLQRSVLVLVLAALAAALAPPAGAAVAHASLTDIENDVMCVSCREPLSVAQSPQAYAERNFIRSLIAQGQTRSQIERQLVAQYGPAVLGRPPAHGFNLTVYVLPPAIVLIGIAVLAFALPRWRRRARGIAPRPVSAGGSLDPAEQQRLDEELSRYRG